MNIRGVMSHKDIYIYIFNFECNFKFNALFTPNVNLFAVRGLFP